MFCVSKNRIIVPYNPVMQFSVLLLLIGNDMFCDDIETVLYLFRILLIFISKNGINFTCLSVADDMLLQSLTKNGLQILINICVAHFKKWRLVYNVLKCIVFNKLASSFSHSQRYKSSFSVALTSRQNL